MPQIHCACGRGCKTCHNMSIRPKCSLDMGFALKTKVVRSYAARGLSRHNISAWTFHYNGFVPHDGVFHICIFGIYGHITNEPSARTLATGTTPVWKADRGECTTPNTQNIWAVFTQSLAKASGSGIALSRAPDLMCFSIAVYEYLVSVCTIESHRPQHKVTGFVRSIASS